MLLDATENSLYEARQMLMAGNYEKAIAEANTAISTNKAGSAADVTFGIEKTTIIVLAQLGLGNMTASQQLLANATQPQLLTLRKYVSFQQALHAHSIVMLVPEIHEDGTVKSQALPG
uniref:Uncharacterized protein n=2 Tax=Lygus hesperus TaxID=30085 RepID=A0A146LZI8_LYGHE